MKIYQLRPTQISPRLSSQLVFAGWLALALLLSQVGANAQSVLNKPVSITIKSASVPDALNLLSKKNDVSLAFSDRFFSANHRVTVNANHKQVNQVLEEILEGTGVGFKEVSGQVVLYLLPKLMQEMTLSGFVEDAETGERLIAATVYCPELGTGTVTNEYGFYSLTLPTSASSLRFSYIGYSERSAALGAKKNQPLNQGLSPSLFLTEVIITPTDSLRTILPSPGSLRRFKPEEFKATPDLGGQNDLMRLIQMLPGVQSGTDGIGGMFIRGGSADQNLVLMDGVPVYNADHLMGMFSIFNTSAIRDAKLLKGGMPARYGGRISSVVDVYTKDGNQNRWGGEIGTDLVGAKATLEGPFAHKKGTLMLSARHTHSDFYLMPAMRKLLSAEDFIDPIYRFYDFNAKLNFAFSEKDKLYLSFYRGKDYFGGVEKFVDPESTDESTLEIGWGNTITSLRWNHLFNQKLFSNTSLTLSHFKFSLGLLSNVTYTPMDSFNLPFAVSSFIGLESQIRDLAWKTDFDCALSPNHYLRFGTNLTAHRFRPNASVFQETFEGEFDLDSLTIDDYFEQRTGKTKNALSFDVYAEDEWKLGSKLAFNTGLRLSGFYSNDQVYLIPEPRLNMAYLINKNYKLTGSITRTAQYLHRVSTIGISFPGDYWTPTDALLKPQKAWQGTVGLEGKLHKGVEFSIEAYYKKMTGLLAFPDSFFFDPFFGENNTEDNFIFIDGKSKGVELLLRKELGRLGGWLGYGISNTTRQSDYLNSGKAFPFIYDRRHELKAFGYYRLNGHWQASFNWIYGSPNPIMTDEGSGNYGPGGKLNSQRGTNYHRLDLALSFSTKTGRLEHQLKASLYNAYNRKNVSFYSFDYDMNGNMSLKPVYLFPIMLGLYYGVRF